VASHAAANRPAPAAARSDEEHLLDFDLGGLTYQPAAAAGTSPARDPAPDDSLTGTAVPEPEFDNQAFAAAETDAPGATRRATDDLSFDLSFDMDLDRSAAQLPTARTANAASDQLPSGAPSAGFDMAELARGFAPAAPAAPEQRFDFDTSDFSQPEAPAAPAEVRYELPQAAAGVDDPFALPAMQRADGANPGDAAPQFDMSAIDLDLPGIDADAPAGAGLETGGGGELSAAQMEMETKLDLAIAYQEIGDKEGARELLDEVIKGGSSEQVSKANAMLAQLA
jgi:pilus assembly protein FimV